MFPSEFSATSAANAVLDMEKDLPQPKTVLDPTELTVADIYAQSVLSLLSDDAAAEEFAAQLQDVFSLLDANGEFEQLLAMSLLSAHERQAIVERVFGGRVGPQMEGLLASLAKHDRLSLLRPLAQRLRVRLDGREGKVEVVVTTAVEPDQDLRAEICKALGATLGRKVQLNCGVDPDLLGGMVVRIGDRVYDASVAGDLAKLSQSLTQKRISRE